MTSLRTLLLALLIVLLAACSPGPVDPAPATPTLAPSPTAPAAELAPQALVTLEPEPIASPTPALAQITLENISRLQELGRMGGGARQISEFAFSPEGRVLAMLWKETSSPSCHVSLVDISIPGEIDEAQAVELFQIEGEPFACEEGYTGFPNIAFSPDGRMLATISIKAGAVTFWDTLTGQNLRHLIWGKEDNPIYGVVFSPTWSMLAWISRSQVQVMDIETGKRGPMLKHQDFVSSAVFSPDGSLLAAASMKPQEGRPMPIVKLWDTARGLETRVLSGPPAGASVLSFSPDGGNLLWGAWNGQVHLWNLANPDKADLVGEGVHSDAISSLNFSPDQLFLVSAGRDHTVKILLNPRMVPESTSGAEAAEVLALPGERAAFSPDGRLMAVVMDGVVSLWGVVP